MATELQKRANRSNALKSTGPTSDAGKVAVRLNATRHGLLSNAPIMAGEDEGEFNALRAQLQSEVAPVGILETQLCERMASTIWRLRRLSHIEAGLLTGNAAQAFADAADAIAQTHTRHEEGQSAALEAMSEEWEGRTVIENEEAHDDASEAANDARARFCGVFRLCSARLIEATRAAPMPSRNFRAMKRRWSEASTVRETSCDGFKTHGASGKPNPKAAHESALFRKSGRENSTPEKPRKARKSPASKLQHGTPYLLQSGVLRILRTL